MMAVGIRGARVGRLSGVGSRLGLGREDLPIVSGLLHCASR
jgi:hypothetical protein